jgi:hypothetical protein
MVYQGTVQNGVVVFPNGVQLPEGSPVRVELVPTEPPQKEKSGSDDILLRMGEYAVKMSSTPEAYGLRERTLFDVLTERGILGCYDGPTDLSTNPKHMEGFGEPRQPKNSH